MITFVYAYYKNGGMFKFQQSVWNKYSDDVKKSIEVIVTDDCSPEKYSIEKCVIEPRYPHMRLFRIGQKVPWNWLECRNIGAHYAKGEWLLLTDMDHVVTPEVAAILINRMHKFDPNIVYQLSRIRAVDGSTYKHHNDSFFVTKELFWRCGGYDEYYSGHYGTSGMFRRRLYSFAAGHRIISPALVLYGREVIKDASTNPKDMKRKEGRKPNEVKELTESKKGTECVHFRYKYKELV